MITQLDIQNVEFSKGVRGYREDEVDQFLDTVAEDVAALTSERDELKEKLEAAEAKISEYKNQEGAVLRTLEAAKALMNDISASAEKRAQVLVQNAELDAQTTRRRAEEAVEKLKEEENRLQQRIAGLRARFKNMLQAELDKFDSLDEDFMGIPSSPEIEKSEEEEKKVTRFDDIFAELEEVTRDDMTKTIVVEDKK